MRIKTLDMRANYQKGTSEFDIVRKALQRSGKYKKNLLYRGFDGDNIQKVLKGERESSGGLEAYDEFSNLIPEEPDKIDEDIIFACTEKEILEGNSRTNIFSYASAVAVFNPKLLVRELKDSYSYKYKNPNQKKKALVSVYKLRYY